MKPKIRKQNLNFKFNKLNKLNKKTTPKKFTFKKWKKSCRNKSDKRSNFRK